MKHVILDRLFAPIDNDKEIPLETPSSWGRKIYGWMDWPELLLLPRVILLAEAGSGKTSEFLCRCEILLSQGKVAFFVRVEDLVDAGLDESLDGAAAARLRAWKLGSETGFFLIDSVDEARLNHKSFETALRRLNREIGAEIGRAHIVVSCRISDWKGRADREVVERLLPVPAADTSEPSIETDAVLLKPIFEKKEKRKDEQRTSGSTVRVVRLMSLSDEDRHALAAASGVPNTDEFLKAIARQGLEPLADRPGDLLDLAEYWNAYGAFASLAEMTEYSVLLKLAERETSRPDNAVLSLEKTRRGAERIAAALTLGHTFTVRAPNQETDPTLVAGALDSKDILPEWTEAERGALLRRGVFAPATYGRVRFHHRATQEYLAAQWFDRLLKSGADRKSINDLLFASRYGTDTVVPSLRAEAAWLALWHRDICNEIVRREPMVLIQNGDPSSLSLETRRDLLLRFADLHQSGDIGDDRLDDRALWLFSQGDLADAVITAWERNSREEFRLYLLRIVREGRFGSCQALWYEVLDKPKIEISREYLRVVALEAATACEDLEIVRQTAKALVERPDDFDESTASYMAGVLFPRHLSTDELLVVIGGCRPISENSVGGFAYVLDKLSAACRDRDERTLLLGGLAGLVLAPPFKDEYTGLSRRHERLAEHLVPLAIEALDELPTGHPGPELIRGLMAIERRDRFHRHDDEEKLRALVRNRPDVNRALLWADVEGAVSISPEQHRPESIHQIHLYGGSLWDFGPGDLRWLIDDIRNRPVLSDRRLALGLAFRVLVETDEWEARKSELFAAARGVSELELLLTELSSPPPQSATIKRMAQRESVYKQNRAEEQSKAKDSWRSLRNELQADPSRISNVARLSPPDMIGFHDLQNLTRWLCHHAGDAPDERAVLQWRALETGFGSVAIAAAYRQGMTYFWRVAPLRWPEHKDGGVVTTYFVTEIAFAGVSLEAAEDVNWAKKLSSAEVVRATELACRSGKNRPTWLSDLVKHHPETSLPELRKTLSMEWTAENDSNRRLISDFAHASEELPAEMSDLLVNVVLGDPPAARAAELGVRILKRAKSVDHARLIDVATARLEAANAAGDSGLVAVNIAMLFLADPRTGILRLHEWIGAGGVHSRKERTEMMLGRLFCRNHGLIPHVLNTAPIVDLHNLLQLSYAEVNPLDDVEHDGVYTPDVRDFAESARNAVLSAIIERPGQEAYTALVAIGVSGTPGIRPTRFREIAHGKVERDAEIVPWTPPEVVAFEATSLLPTKTPEDFHRVVLRVLDEVQYGLTEEDGSPRRLLQSAVDEDQVQGWLAGELKTRSRDRYHVHRETEVSDKKEPDIVASAIAIPAQVAIEVKNANKGWTIPDLEHALRIQLVEQYLRPADRRHGILVVTLHKPRTWKDPVTKAPLSFDQVMARLTALAETIVRNDSGPVSVRVVGINVT